MTLDLLFVSGRSVTFQLEDGGLFATERAYRVLLNGAECGEMTTVVTSRYGLWPDTPYTLTIMDGENVVAENVFRTEPETVTLNVRRFGAVGDGEHDDTPAIQAAINCCPPQGRVLIPAGKYVVLPLFLRSHIRIELAKGATLMLETDRSRFPVLPGMTEFTTEDDDLNLGTWEGNPLDTFASFITGIGAEDTVVYGEGVLDGRAQQSDWWLAPKIMRVAFRPRMVFLSHCKGVTLQGVTVRNSPSWNLHPYFSEDLKFLNVKVEAPADSPNTDGFDPESCARVLVAGTHFSLGDDCIAIKAGKIYMGARYKTPCTDLEISHCLMENGHGGVTVGSEMAGGVQRVRIHDCLMRNTDRGLRIKTRRGRGKDGLIDDILFENVRMAQVGTPLVVNAMYFCDPDGHSPYVQTREKLPVDERTPHIGRITFRRVDATGCACAGYVLGLPEDPVECIRMEQVRIACAPDARPMEPAMSEGVPMCVRTGLVAINAARIELDDVTITGCDGEAIVCEGETEIVRR